MEKGYRISADILRTPGLFTADLVALIQALLGLIYSNPASKLPGLSGSSREPSLLIIEMQVVVRVFLDVLEEIRVLSMRGGLAALQHGLLQGLTDMCSNYFLCFLNKKKWRVAILMETRLGQTRAETSPV